jgi:hypothetical protein
MKNALVIGDRIGQPKPTNRELKPTSRLPVAID